MVRVRLDEVVDDRCVDEAGRDADEAEVIREGSIPVAVVRNADAKARRCQLQSLCSRRQCSGQSMLRPSSRGRCDCRVVDAVDVEWWTSCLSSRKRSGRGRCDRESWKSSIARNRRGDGLEILRHGEIELRFISSFCFPFT